MVATLYVQQAAMREAGAIGRLLTFITSSDPEVAERTWASFTVAFSFEGVVLGVIGFFITYFGLLAATVPLRLVKTA